jgi:hypothetical protein
MDICSQHEIIIIGVIFLFSCVGTFVISQHTKYVIPRTNVVSSNKNRKRKQEIYDKFRAPGVFNFGNILATKQKAESFPESY